MKTFRNSLKSVKVIKTIMALSSFFVSILLILWFCYRNLENFQHVYCIDIADLVLPPTRLPLPSNSHLLLIKFHSHPNKLTELTLCFFFFRIAFFYSFILFDFIAHVILFFFLFLSLASVEIKKKIFFTDLKLDFHWT